MKCCAYFLFASLLCFAAAGKLPSTFTICKRNDPDLESCYAKAIENALPYLKEGIPSLGILSIEPVEVDSITTATGTGDSSIYQKQINVKVYHIIDSKINKTELTVGIKEWKQTIYAYTKLLRVESDYEATGKVLALPITGNGKSVIEVDDLQTEIKASGEYFEKSGKTYIRLLKIKVNLSPGKLRFDYQNLFSGHENLGKEMNTLLNENWRAVFSDFKEAYENVITKFFLNIFNAVVTRVPVDELFPL